MTNLTLVENGATWPWNDNNITGVEFQPVSGAATGWQRYQMYITNLNQAMHAYQSHSSSIAYDIKRNTSNDEWADEGTDNPSHFVISSSTTQPSSPTTGGTFAASSSNKYLHLFIGTASQHYAGYIEVWTPFHSGSGSGGGIGTLSGGTAPEIKDVSYSKVTDSIVYLSFNWQNVNTAALFKNGAFLMNISLGGLGNSGTISGSGYLTNINEGDKIWIANSTDDNGNLPVYTHRKINWSVGLNTSGVKSVIAKTFAYDTGQSYDLRFLHPDVTSTTIEVTHDGTEQTAYMTYAEGFEYKAADSASADYGTPYLIRKKATKVSSNFW